MLTKEQKEKKRQYNIAYYKANQDKAKEKARRGSIRRHGISVETYNKMWVEQGGKCKICGSAKGDKGSNGRRLNIDHDHTTGQIRGLLCVRCNRCLGLLNDSTDRLQKAIDYLRSYMQ